MAKYLDIIKTIFTNKRYRSILILGLYIIFFTVVIVISKTPVKEEVKLSSIDIFKNMQEFNFKVEVDDNYFTGYYEKENITINYKNVEYQIDTLPDDFEYQEIIDYINPNYIYNLIKNKDYDSQTKYKDNSISKNYIIDDVDLSLYENEKIYQIVIKINNKTYKITYNN